MDYGVELISTAGIGYSLAGDLDNLRAVLDRVVTADGVPYEYVLSPQERVRHILLLMLGDDRTYTLHEDLPRPR